MSFLDGLFRNTVTDLEVSETEITTPEADIDIGFVYAVEAQLAPIELTLESHTLSDVAGKRFGVKLSENPSDGDAEDLTITVPDGQQIQEDGGAFGQSASFPQDSGAYREYICDAQGHWYLIARQAAADV